ncbi:MAG TPA: GNAT family protein [Thermoanaerobaculia bacterium]|nr:GNAT family protein [Thermoanaerobaculia bacterium]
MEPQAFLLAHGLQVLPPDPSFAEPLAELVRRNALHFGRYLPPVAELVTPEAALSHLADMAQRLERGDLLEWYLFTAGTLCGSLRLNHFEPANRKAALGYFLGAEYQGRGIVTRAARAVLGYAFQRLGLHRIELRCDTHNEPSIRVAERLGFTREGELREAELLAGSFVSLYVYSLLRPEFPEDFGEATPPAARLPPARATRPSGNRPRPGRTPAGAPDRGNGRRPRS